MVDVNDRELRKVVLGLGTRVDGYPREGGFDISVASEVMAILALTTGLKDMRQRRAVNRRCLSRILEQMHGRELTVAPQGMIGATVAAAHAADPRLVPAFDAIEQAHAARLGHEGGGLS